MSANQTTLLSMRKTSTMAGILYLLTFVSIPTLSLYSSIHNAKYIISNGPDNPVIIGGLLEILAAIAGIGTAVVLYPILTKQNKAMALGLFASRLLEAGTIFVGVAFLLAVVTLRQSGMAKDAIQTGQALVALYDRISLLGQGFIPAINDVLLGTLLYRSRLVPRGLSLVGIVGGPILLIGYFGVMFGLVQRISPVAGLSAVPVALFECSLGFYLVVNGFKSPRIITEEESSN